MHLRMQALFGRIRMPSAWSKTTGAGPHTWATPQHMPLALLATMPPIMALSMDAGSGPRRYITSCPPLLHGALDRGGGRGEIHQARGQGRLDVMPALAARCIVPGRGGEGRSIRPGVKGDLHAPSPPPPPPPSQPLLLPCQASPRSSHGVRRQQLVDLAANQPGVD